MPFPPTGPSKKLEERSHTELIVWIVLFPLLAAVAASFIAWDAVRNSADWTFADWFWHVGWTSLLALVLGIGLPATAKRELDRRKANDKQL